MAIWSAATHDGSGFWTVGSATAPALRGVYYTPAGAVAGTNSSTQGWVAGSGDGWTNVGVVDSKLYAMYYLSSAAVKNIGRNATGEQLPTTWGQDLQGLPVLPWVSTYRYRQFALVPAAFFAIVEELQGGFSLLSRRCGAATTATVAALKDEAFALSNTIVELDK